MIESILAAMIASGAYSETANFEGLRLKSYRDSVGNYTIGIGHHLGVKSNKKHQTSCKVSLKNSKGQYITNSQAACLYKHNYIQAIKDSTALIKNFNLQPVIVQAIINDMSFNMGKGNLSEFRNMLRAVETGNYEQMYYEMVTSKWCLQLDSRCKYQAEKLMNGVINNGY